MLNRIFGLETEYGLLVHQDRPDHSPTWFAHKIRDYLFHVQRQGVLDLHHRGHDEPPGNGGFLTNAGRIYLDMGHLEYASPECHSLTDMVASDRAGDTILQKVIQDLGLADEVSLIKNNMDHETDATFGSHENYLVTRRFPFTRRGLIPLVSFLVTRQIFTGSGRVGAASPQDAWIQMDRLIVPRAAVGRNPLEAQLPFQISQRADHIVNDFFEWVQQNRAIVNTRDEPLADPNQYRQDEETDWVLEQWESVLHDLRGDYEQLVGRVDWASKLWLLESFREAEGLEWTDPMLKSLDLEYHNLNPKKGLYYGLLEEGRVPRLTTDKAIDLAMEHPPRNTRASARGELVKHLLACGPPAEPNDSRKDERFFPSYVINWSIFQLRGQAPFPMPDPFKTYVQEVRSLLAAC